MKKFIFAAILGLAISNIPSLVQAAPPASRGPAVSSFPSIAPVNSYYQLRPYFYAPNFPTYNYYPAPYRYGVVASPWGVSSYARGINPYTLSPYATWSGYNFPTGTAFNYGWTGWGW